MSVKLHEYLKGNYELEEPIFSGDISVPERSEENLQYHLSGLRMTASCAGLRQESIISPKQIYLGKDGFDGGYGGAP